MTFAFRIGPYGVRLADSDAEVAACQALRHRCFFGGAGLDAEAYDALCDHLMVADGHGLVATCRVRRVTGAGLAQTYAGARYDLTRLMQFDRPLLEMGRFCIAPRAQDADVMRLMWGALAQMVARDGIGLLFGCTSFAGVDPAPYGAVFTRLATRHQAPGDWAPGVGSAETVALGQATKGGRAAMPPLLRSYLGMGGWVSDHAVVDREMQTLHVFTGLETDRVPPRRAAALKAMMA